jgi:hypothetical protein
VTEEERNLDLIIGDLEQENRLLRARNERLEKMDLTDEEIDRITIEQWGDEASGVIFQAHRVYARAIIAKMKS